MNDDLLPFDIETDLSAIIKVIGVGGGGSNAVNHMYQQGIKGVDFIVCNTDYQALKGSPVPIKIQLGAQLTEGLGAGNQPERGKEAAIESIEDVKKEIGKATKMLFITAGMGGGTGTGAAPIIAQAAKEMGILTVGIVTLPFRYEGRKRIKSAIEGIAQMAENVDSLLLVNNEKLREIYGNLAGTKAFSKADDVLTVAAKGIAEIITIKGHINVDFADVNTVMSNSGIALMGTGTGTGDERAKDAVEAALNSPLLDNNDINGSKDILLNITSGNEKEATMDEISYINEFIQEAAGNDADLIWGSSIDETLDDEIIVTVIATGFKMNDIPEIYSNMPEIPNKKRQITSETEINQEEVAINQDPILDDNNNDIDFEVEYAPESSVVASQNNSEETGKIINHLSDNNDVEIPQHKPQEVLSYTKEETKKQEKHVLSTENNYKPFIESQATENIKEYEDIPAFMRENKEEKQEDEDDLELSRFSINTSGDDITISEDNPHLHDKAD